ncbi:TonB-dependent receptor plug domain-containing protein [Mucilaginibacter sp. RS28]|uniref:TonB-dependent receptor plug domain-containing protein n=1 Tax=Mucilaginibacter straminoryzae TaxID=2932774 RepID=A0A9X2BDM1_9SPHI|nr:M56 family metallopeptidase [Mucilaginibacter straminoryzae]MCJ8210468.1 TonB-dependent receptor plug domain-containing protein [Mucilaginibacter straminoryzae]
MTWWQYLILANIYLLLFCGFYKLLLRRETFFYLNRLYLVSTAILSFLLPLIQADWARQLFITQKINHTIYQLDPMMIYQQQQDDDRFTVGSILGIVYLVGMVLLALRFIIQLLILRKRLQSELPDDAYSFFGTIKLSDKIIGRNIILEHELVHARQWHSADIILVEAIMIVNWFNPAVYWYRSTIKHIHEFIADRNAINNGTPRHEYALLLLSETFKTPPHQLSNPFFNHSLLKQRIQMLQRNKSHKVALLKYGLSAPLFALMLILSSAATNTQQAIQTMSSNARLILQIPANPSIIKALQSPLKLDAGIAKNTTTAQPAARRPALSPAHYTVAITQADTSAAFNPVTHQPEYPGGVKAFAAFIGRNIKQTLQVSDGKPIIMKFMVEKDGTLSEIEGLRGSPEAIREATRVLSLSPKWEPGEQDGYTARMQMVVPMRFKLPSENMLMTTHATGDTSGRIKVISISSNASGQATFTRTDTTKSSGNVLIYRLPAGPRTPGNDLSKKQPLYIVDGVASDISALKHFKPDQIERINILKGEQAVSAYGANAQNGVIEITTKPMRFNAANAQ